MSLGKIECEELEVMSTESSLEHFTVKGAYTEMITRKSNGVFFKGGYEGIFVGK